MASPSPPLKELNIFDLSPPLNTTLVSDAEGLKKIKDFLSRETIFGFDVETNITPTFVDRKVRTIQIGNKTEQYVLDLLAFAGSPEALKEQGSTVAPDWAKPIVEVLQPALDSSTHLKVGVNIEFDVLMALWNFGIRCWNVHCCLLTEKVIYAGLVNYFAKGFWAMDDMVAGYCRLKVSKDEQKGFDLETPLTESQVRYCGLDVRLPLAIRQAQMISVAKHGLERVVKIENDAVPAFAEMHMNGVYLDSAAWMEIVEEVEREHEKNVQRLDTLFSSTVGTFNKLQAPYTKEDINRFEQEWRDSPDGTDRRREARAKFQTANRELRLWLQEKDDFEGNARINYGSHKQLLAALRKMGYGPGKLPSTDDTALNTLKGDPVIDALRAYRATEIRLKTYGRSFLNHIHPTTGRVHSKINQIGAETGRTSSTKPNIQNIPKGSKYRGSFRARPGYVWVSVDMAGAELRILAELSGDPLLVGAFSRGEDVHSIGAELIFGQKWKDSSEPDCAYYAAKKKCKCRLHKKLRDIVKALNFGIIYGKEYKSFAEELGVSEDEAKSILAQWRSTYKVAWAFLVELGNSGKMNHKVRTFSGRVRHFPKPDWDKAKQSAMEKRKKAGKNPDEVTGREVTRVYHGQYGGIERESKNTPHQGGNADIAKIVLGSGSDEDGKPFLYHQLPTYGAVLCNFVHDEVCAEVPEENAEAYCKMLDDCIIRAGRMLMKRVPMESEATVGDRWKK